MGIVWFLMYLTGAIKLVARYTPREVIRGIQVSLGLLLAKDLPMEARLLSAAVTVLVFVFSNMAFGYAAGMAFHYICFSR